MPLPRFIIHNSSFIILSLIALLSLHASAATPTEVESAIEKAKDYLYKQMEKDGTWEHGSEPTKESLAKDVVKPSRWGGTTALSVYALLAAGERPTDPRLARAIDFLKKADMIGTYPIAVRILAMSYLPQADDVKAVLKKDQAKLLAMVQTEGNAKGMYDYVSRDIRNATHDHPSKHQDYSHSRAQYGLLGVWIATELGLDSPLAYWKTAEEGWIRNQDPSGGWNYTHPADTSKDNKVTVGRTGAGIASLYLAQDFTHPGAELRGNVKTPAIEKAMAWLNQNFVPLLDSHGKEDYICSSLYVVERVGVASGVKYIGGKDWFQSGADLLMKLQRADGAWSGEGGATGTDTAFGLLFLSRGRSPVIIEKLSYETGPDGKRKEALWNQRPRDIANIVRYHSHQIEREVNWQIADLKMPGKDLFDAPILYIPGTGNVEFTPDEETKLKDYVRGGGLILCHADGSDSTFANCMQKLGQKLFGGYEFRALPEKHPVFKLVDRKTGGDLPKIIGLSNGIRELMLIINAGDPSRKWQTQSFKADSKNAAALMEGIMQYVSDTKSLRYRGEDLLITPNPDIKDERTIKIARIEYEGNWDPEPAALPRLARYLHNTQKTKLEIQPVKPADGNLKGFQIAHLTGTAKFRLDPVVLAELKSFTDSGGLLLVEAAGGSINNADFLSTAEPLLKEIFPNKDFPLLPPTHPLYAANAKPTDPHFRPFTLKKPDAPNTPQLRALEQSNHLTLLLSDLDLSSGWLGDNVDNIDGYTPDYALELGAKIILYAQK